MVRKKGIMISIFITIILLTVSSCATQPVKTDRVIIETREVPKFVSINLSVHGTVFVTQGKKQSLEIKTDNYEVMRHLKTEVKNGTLKISSNRKVPRASNLRINIVMKQINELGVSGSGRLVGENRIITDEIVLKLNGSGNISLKLAADRINTKISGSGRVHLAGKAKQHKIKLDGSGMLSAFKLITEKTAVKIEGSGICRIKVSKQLDVEINGSGTVIYKGDPKVKSKGSGSGSVRSQY